MKTYAGLAAAFAVAVLSATGSTQSTGAKTALPKPKWESRDGIPQVVFNGPDPAPQAADNWHAPPQPLEAELVKAHGEHYLQLPDMLKTPAKPVDDPTCLMLLQRDTAAFQAATLASAYNILVGLRLPGYADKPQLPALNEAQLGRMETRLEQDQRRCMSHLPLAVPEFDPTYDARNPLSVQTRELGFKALEQMGDAMLDQTRINKVFPKFEVVPDEGKCQQLTRTWSYWDRVYGRMPEGASRDNAEVQMDKMREGVFAFCPGPRYR